jgi:hypothetical protein
MQELQTLDDSLFPEVYDFIEFLKQRYSKLWRETPEELTQNVNTVYSKLGSEDMKQAQQVADIAMASVWETRPEH